MGRKVRHSASQDEKIILLILWYPCAPAGTQRVNLKMQFMIFNRITIIDNCGLVPSVLEQLKNHSSEPIMIYSDFPETDEEIIRRIGDSDCILVSWRTKVNSVILHSSKSLKYIGMCCSLYDEKAANVDIITARKLGIDVKGVRDYGDEGTVEFIFAELIYLFKGRGIHKWRSETSELKNKSIGIVGLGTLGLMVAKTAVVFGMQVYYYSRTRKYELENENLRHLSLVDLLKTCDVVTTHLPKNSLIISEAEFSFKKRNSIFINTSIGLTCDINALSNWLTQDKTSFAIFDGPGLGSFSYELSKFENVIISKESSGFTSEAKVRLSEKVLQNALGFLRGCHSIRKK